MSDLYIDGDILLYKVGFSVEDRGTGAVESDFATIVTMELAIKNICRAIDYPSFAVVISGEDNFREKIATIQPYKGNRSDKAKPIQYQLLRDWVLSRPYSILAEGEEADDVLSIACMQGATIATIDKDLNNTPGWHYNWNKNLVYEVTHEEALRNFYTQCLTGDTADNIPGVRGIGPVKAKKLLADCHMPFEYEDVILKTYEGKFEDPRAALTEIGQLLWMRREVGEMWGLCDAS